MSGDSRCEEWVVAPAEARTRLDQFLTTRGTLGTRSQVHKLITAGCVRLDGQPAKGGVRLRVGQRVSVERPILAPGEDLEPAPIPLDVLYEDDALMVINKPPGLVVHPAPGHWQGTLVHALLYRWGGFGAGFDPLRPGIVHRLDKDTSGVLIVAKDVATLADLGRQFRRREIHKQYLAIAWGRFQQRSGVMREKIGRDRIHRKRMAVQSHGREAVTRYEVVEDFGVASLVRAYPETGRTHQIRVHLAAAGHPLVADAQYARGRRGVELPIERQALHAECISFRHPVSGQLVRVAAPLPPDFQAALEALRQYDA